MAHDYTDAASVRDISDRENAKRRARKAKCDIKSISQILELIKDEAECSSYCIFLFGIVPPLVKKELTERGFLVKKTHIYHGTNPGNYTTISW